MMQRAFYKAWAIDPRSDEGHFLIGKYWWFGGEPSLIPSHMEGYRHAVFLTRSDARVALADVKRAFPRAKVIRIKVEVST